jgi:probable HAF family extracellular repeat protein
MESARHGMGAVFLLSFASLTWAQSYTITDLGTLSGGYSDPTGINDHGAVVGNATVAPNSAYRAFLWTAAQGMQNLGTLPGGSASFGQGINIAGEVVGASYSATTSRYSAFLWTKGGGMQDLGTLGGSNSFAYGINNSGAVVGYADLPNGTTDAFLWTQAEGMEDLGNLGGGYAVALGIDDSGEVVGYSSVINGSYHAFTWTQAAGMQDINRLNPATNSVASAINLSGQIAGYAVPFPTTPPTSAVIWAQGGAERVLGAGAASAAVGMNNLGAVVGFQGPHPEGYAWLWTPAGGVENLNDLIPPNSGWMLDQASAINQTGEIAAAGIIDSQTHAALLTPAE